VGTDLSSPRAKFGGEADSRLSLGGREGASDLATNARAAGLPADVRGHLPELADANHVKRTVTRGLIAVGTGPRGTEESHQPVAGRAPLDDPTARAEQAGATPSSEG
jgi:hypothetical protein